MDSQVSMLIVSKPLQLINTALSVYLILKSIQQDLTMTFHPDSLPGLTGRVYIVTGGNSGM